MRNRILTILALTVAALIPVSGTTIRPAEALTDPMYGAPTVGQCYNMSGTAVYNSMTATAPTVPCSGQHTVLITDVVQVPASMPLSGTAFYTFTTNSCLPSTITASGGSALRYGRSSYAGYTFLPTAAQQDQGAHWVTCMMGIMQGTSVLRVTGAYPHLPRNPAPRLTFCLRSDFYPTNCAAAHKWHPVSTLQVTATRSYISRKAYAVCRAHFGARATGWAVAWKLIRPTGTWVVSCMRP